MKLTVVVMLLLLVGAAYLYTSKGTVHPNPHGVPSEDNVVVLYGLENDGFTQLRRVQLEKQGLGFTEVLPLEDDARYERLERRLLDSGHDFQGLPLVYQLPVVEVNGKLLSRPSIELIWEHLRYE
jgi:hypothetical protein